VKISAICGQNPWLVDIASYCAKFGKFTTNKKNKTLWHLIRDGWTLEGISDEALKDLPTEPKT
jgi:hypothetical protein